MEAGPVWADASFYESKNAAAGGHEPSTIAPPSRLPTSAGAEDTQNRQGTQTAPPSIATTNASESSSRVPLAILQTAQDIPDAPHTQQVDSFDPGQGLDLYRITIDPNTRSLEIYLKAIAPSTSLPGRIWIVDESGRIVGDWRLAAGTKSITLDLRFAQRPVGSTIVFGISQGDLPPDPSGASNFELSITRASAPSPVPFGDQTGPMPIVAPAPGPAPPGGAGGSNTPVPSNISESIAPIIPSGRVTVSLAIGALPARSAAPSGGRFASGEPTPPIGPLDAALVDLQLIDLLPRGLSASASELTTEDAGDDLGTGDGPPAQTALQVSGGFPLMAAALTGPLRPTQAPEAAILPSFDDHGCVPVLTACAIPLDRASPATSRPNRRSGVWLAFNVAATLASGLLLPDLVAALQIVAPRRPLPRALRLGHRPDGGDPGRARG
jgi:hypothetical protein